MNVYHKPNVIEAIELATAFQQEGRYNWFRGQTSLWPPTPTFLRLNDTEQQDAKERLGHYYRWMLRTPGLEYLTQNIDKAIAVAQHYGFPTNFLDFTRSPAIAGFFASVDRKRIAPSTACIFCLNTDNLTEFWRRMRAVLPHYPNVELVEVSVPNLWRLEAQDGVFLHCPLNWDKYYPMDIIEFPLSALPPYLNREQIYPTRKSHLEQLLDHFFDREKLQCAQKAIMQAFSGIDVLELRSPVCGYHAEYFTSKGLSKCRDWSKAKTKDWLVIPTEGFYAATKGEIELTVDNESDPKKIRDDISLTVYQSLENQPLLRSNAIEWKVQLFGKTPNPLKDALNKLWDGLRCQPFSNKEISDGIGQCVALFSLKFHRAKKIDRSIAIAEKLMGKAFEVEMSSRGGSYVRAIVSYQELSKALRSDIRSKLKPEYRQYEKSAAVLLQFCWEPQRLFSFERFSRLLATQIAPTQVLMSMRVPCHFSPARIVGFGLP